MEYKLKITYKMNEKELYDYNMFRMTHKTGSVVARAVIVACIYVLSSGNFNFCRNIVIHQI